MSLKSLSVFYFLSFCLFNADFARSMSAKDYSALFEKEYKINKYDLGPQCAFSSLSEVKKAESLVNNKDYQLTYPEFLDKVKKLGLLDTKLFFDPKNTDANYEQVAINSILTWTKNYQDQNLIYSKEKCFLSDKEIFSIFYYTGEGYKILNTAIRNHDQTMIQKLEIIGIHLGLGLQKLNPYRGFVKRVRDLDMSDPKKVEIFNQENKVGAIVEQTAYTSTTIATTSITGNVEYVIKTKKNCYYIADFSLVEQKVNGYSQMEEEEVLCLPKTKFKVLFHNEENGLHKIVMEEVE